MAPCSKMGNGGDHTVGGKSPRVVGSQLVFTFFPIFLGIFFSYNEHTYVIRKKKKESCYFHAIFITKRKRQGVVSTAYIVWFFCAKTEHIKTITYMVSFS